MFFSLNSTTVSRDELFRNISTTISFPFQESSENQNIVHGIILLLLSIVGCMFNSFIIIAIVPNQRLRSVRNILLVHLAVVGIVTSILNTFFAAVTSLNGSWIGGIVTCKMYGFFESTLTSSTVWTIAALSWDKYQTIASPLHHSLSATVRKMTILFSLFWIFAVLLSVPPLFVYEQTYTEVLTKSCYTNYFRPTGSWYVAIIFVFVYILPLVMLLYCYIHIYRIARNQSSRIAATMIRMTCVVQAPIALAGQSAPISTSVKGTKAILTILQLVGTFTLTYIPYAIVIIVHAYCLNSCVNSTLRMVVMTLVLAAPVTNGVVYGVRNKILRGSFHRYMRREIRHMCYKDKRRGSVKSRNSSFRMSLRRQNQNGGPESQPFRRTQSLKANHLSPSRPSLLNLSQKQSLRKTQSFSLSNGHTPMCLDDKLLNTPQTKDSESDISEHVTPILEEKEPNGNVSNIAE